MNTVSVIVPFFQREPGILGRALRSVLAQQVPGGWAVEVVVVDDGSPVPAEEEVGGLRFAGPFRLKVVRTENGGAGAARNRGLAEADPSAALVAFLDSDDVWPADHLARAIRAAGEGFDFYFTDNRREGHHESHCRSPLLPKTAALLDGSPQKTGLLEVPIDQMAGLALGEFPCQASTVVYRRGINDALRFNTDLKSSGEDVLFFTTLVASASRVCMDLDSVVACGGGVNIYFSNLTWDSDRFLAISVDHLVMRRLIAGRLNLSAGNKQWNDRLLDRHRAALALQMLRNLVKNPARAWREAGRLARLAPGAAVALPADMIRAGLARVFRRHGPVAGTRSVLI